MMEQAINGPLITETYWSLAEYADTAGKRVSRAFLERTSEPGREEFTHVASFDDALTLAKYGWQDEMPAALELAESAVKLAAQDHMVDTFNPVWDVTGAEVDIGRYLQGEPECMIDFPLSKTSKSGRVITLVTSVTFSSAIQPETIIKRGQLVVALALALNTLGHAVEIWADLASQNKGLESYQRVLVKSASDELDPASLMFALAHPAMLRCLGLAIKDGYPGQWGKAFGKVRDRGSPAKRTEGITAMFPEGAIFLPEIKSSTDVPDADKFLRQYLGDLGLLAEA